MTQSHLNDLEAAIERAGWTVVAKKNGDRHGISALWQLERRRDKAALTLEFNGLEHLTTLPVEQSYGCSVVGHRDAECYFARKGRSWPRELRKFQTFLCQWP